MSDRVILIIGGFVLLLFSLFLVASLHDYEVNCLNRGGHVVSVGRGQVCVSSDGRIIEW